MRLPALFATALVLLACSPEAGAPLGDRGHTEDDSGASPAIDAPVRSAVNQSARATAGDEAPAASAAASADASAHVVLFLGNSLTAGYGLTAEEAYPALIQRKIDDAGYSFRVVNAGVSGETSAGGLRRIDWLLRQPVAVLVLALGANDALRGQDLDATRANLQAIVDRTRTAHPAAAIVIAGMQAPPNLGADYTDRFRRMFVELAEANGAALIPFLLEGVAAVPELNQQDGIHPTAEGQRILAENVWRTLETVLRRVAEERGEG